MKWNGLEFSGVTNDSRLVKPGFIFCAIQGASFDGRTRIPQAIAAGASAIVAERGAEIPAGVPFLEVPNAYRAWGELCAVAEGFPADSMTLHAVTGTNGKTTTAFILKNLISGRCGLLTTVLYDDCSGNPPEEAPRTTPDAMTFQKLLSRMRLHHCSDVVMEMSSHGIHQYRTGNARFHTAVFTNLTGDHLDYHHTMEAYYQAKKILFAELLEGPAIINIDDSYGMRLASELSGSSVITFSTKKNADCRVSGIELSASGSRFQLNFKGTVLNISTNLIGLHNVRNLSEACAAALAYGIPAETVGKRACMEIRVPGRLERIGLKNGASAFVDYAHTDDALQNVLKALRPLCSGKLICVFGCGGDRDKTKRSRMGKVVSELADLMIVTSDNPRSEKPESIIADIMSGVTASAVVEPDRRAALRLAAEIAEPGDVILAAGKGHETYQEISGVKHHFDDREELSQL